MKPERTVERVNLRSLGVGALLLAAGCFHRVDYPRVAEWAPAQEAIWIAGVAVNPGRGEAALEDRDVLVRGGQIAAITPAGEAPPPAEALVLDGAGRTLLPGLIDLHTHIGGAGGPPWRLTVPDEEHNTWPASPGRRARICWRCPRTLWPGWSSWWPPVPRRARTRRRCPGRGRRCWWAPTAG
jgi:hypothetical protein